MEKLFSVLSHIHVVKVLKRTCALLGMAVATALTLLLAAFCAFTFWLLPNLNQFRQPLERYLSQSLGRPVQVAALSGEWLTVGPRFELGGVTIANPQDGKALTLLQVSLEPSWRSLLALEPRLSSVVVKGPAVELLRSRQGVIYLNGFDLSSGPAGSGLGNWLLRQSSLEIIDARLSWQDELLGLPRLDLSQGQLKLSAGLFGHGLKLSGQPAASLGKGFDLTAAWRGDDIAAWQQWSGSIKVALDGARAGSWTRYLQQLGMLRSGEGSGTVEMSFSDGAIDALKASVNVHDAAYTPPDSHELVLPRLQGELQLTRQLSGSYKVKASRLSLASASGLAFDNSNIDGEWRYGEQGFGQLTLDNVDLSHLTPFIHALGADRNPLFARFSPSGALRDLTVSWKGALEAPRAFKLKSRFEKLAWQPFDELPGVAGVSGAISFDEKGGRLQLDTGKSQVSYPSVFVSPLAFDKLTADVGWQRQGQAVALDFRQVAFSNADLSGSLQGSYRHQGGGAGIADLRASIAGVPAARVAEYLPHEVGEHTLRWLRQALQGGQLRQATMKLRGDLDQFPFAGGKGGEFLVEAEVERARLSYQPGWPRIDDIDAQLLFRNERMEVNARRATTVGVPLSGVKAVINNLGADVPMLAVEGRAADRLQRMLAFTTQSPVDGWLDGFTGQIEAGGNASLDLKLAIPLAGEQGVGVRGDLHFADNALQFKSLPIPPLSKARGRLTFTERGVDSPGLQFSSFGGAFQLKASTGADKRMRFELAGQADSRQVLKQYLPALAEQAAGKSGYRAQFVVKQGLESLTVASDLQGTAFDLPPPLAKAAATALPLQLQLRPQQMRGAQTLRLDFSLDGMLGGRLRLNEHGDLQAGALGVGRAPGEPAASGLTVRVAQPRVVLDDWLKLADGAAQSSGGGGPGALSALPALQLELETPELVLPGLSLHKVNARLGNRELSKAWTIQLRSNEMSGDASYRPEGNGLLQANLSRLALTLPADKKEGATEAKSGGETSMLNRRLPEMKVRVGELVLQGRSVGRLELEARRDGSVWQMAPLRLTTNDGTLKATVRSDARGAGNVDARFELNVSDAGKLLARLGQGEIFRNGQGSLSGRLNWPGGLGDLDLAKVSGELALDFKDGRFAKVDPGVVKLLGALSLQSLPRRIRLDFTDVFSDGFAFDSLKGEAQARNGLFTSPKVEMKGPGADVAISGELDLGKETQTLKVHVMPRLAESVALAAGAALLNPVVGIATLAAQKVLRDPVGRILSVDYEVSGSLRDPKVVRTAIGPIHQNKGGKP
ncbi:YhdP family protein [Chromobacterium haemolyticum]|uniref:YhdP family protein n=2 Tax=Chromobacterium haemolyticum TaxID=394935 RepID=UPI0012DEA6EF|nr:YhdP family protein [Chromobacterium haemolyticum]